MLRFCAALTSLRIFRWVTLGFLVIAHTHEDLDGAYGQITVKLSFEQFNDPNEVLECLQRIVDAAGIDSQTSCGRNAVYKLDQVALWDTWAANLGVTFADHTGPDAPHFFKFCSRSDLGFCDGGIPGAAAVEGGTTPEWAAHIPRDTPSSGEDVMLVTKHLLSSQRALQVVGVIPAGRRANLPLPAQPAGVQARNARPDAAEFIRSAEKAYSQGAINSTARNSNTSGTSNVSILTPPIKRPLFV